VQVGQVGAGESPVRLRVEEYLGALEAPAEAADAVEAPPTERTRADPQPPSASADVALAHALAALDSCVALLQEAPTRSEPAPTEDATPERALENAATTRAAQRLARLHLPRGLLYWLVVGVTASLAWHSTSSLYEAVVAGLIASAAVITLEIVLRAVDPSIARRLGLGRPRSGVLFYASGALIAMVIGVAIAYGI
jgi:hypothetical protein